MVPLTPSFPVENKKGIKEVHSNSYNFSVNKSVNENLNKVFLDNLPKETSKNHVLVGDHGLKKDYSYAFYNPHNARYYFDFNKWNFKPFHPKTMVEHGFEVINSKEFVLKDFMGCRVVVKKTQIEITNKIDSKRLFKIDGSADNRKFLVSDAITTLENECIEVLRNVISIWGGASSFKCIKISVADNKILHDKVIDSLPDSLTWRNDVSKKVYLETPNNVEISSPVGASNTFRNLALYDYAPEIAKELSDIRSEFNGALKDLKDSALIPLTEQIKLHLEVMHIMKETQLEQTKTMKVIQDSLIISKKEKARDLLKEFGW